SASQLLYCASVYYADGNADTSCATVSGDAGDKGIVTAEVALDPARPLSSVNIRIDQQGGDPVVFTLDAASAFLDVVAPPPPGGGGDGGGGGGGGGGGSTGPSCAGTNPDGVYHGFTYQLPSARPVLALRDYLPGRADSKRRPAAHQRRQRPARGKSAVPVHREAHGAGLPPHRPAAVPDERRRADRAGRERGRGRDRRRRDARDRRRLVPRRRQLH